ncbi:hypothetical protein V7x_28870 [Crateriforma conspicua]|uniref:Uncharacterized protein n=1 Tax=Crateriforma conspicua TaxID=2527996 RepID=A0A5C6G288_9PLAN|nr:hypothetical protein [Crateriforma conspicua]TWU67313.1 hypothetical protein V7x_28870 [Crateriforma conspicua]
MAVYGFKRRRDAVEIKRRVLDKAPYTAGGQLPPHLRLDRYFYVAPSAIAAATIDEVDFTDSIYRSVECPAYQFVDNGDGTFSPVEVRNRNGDHVAHAICNPSPTEIIPAGAKFGAIIYPGGIRFASLYPC